MIWLYYNSELGMYGMRELSADGEPVVEPYDDREGLTGIDWTTVAPEWVRSNTGTVVVLLGGNETTDTFWGKQGRDHMRNVRGYINARFWDIPEGTSIKVVEATRRELTARSREEAFASHESDRNKRECVISGAYGAKRFLSEDLGSSGYVDLKDGTRVLWFLRRCDWGSDGGYRPARGYVAALYRNELYSNSNQPQTFRAWGIGEPVVSRRLSLIVEPLLAGEHEGVFPGQARATLMMQRSTGTAELPWDQWRDEFRDNLPAQIIEALREASHSNEQRDERLLEIDRRLRERYAGENLAELKLDPRGSEKAKPNHGEGPQEHGPRRPQPKRPKRINTGPSGSDKPASLAQQNQTSLPDFRWFSADEFDESERHFGAVWVEPNATKPRGFIRANRDFAPVRLLVKELQKLWPAAFAERVEEAALNELRVSLVAKVAEFNGHMTDWGWKAPAVRDALENPATLTFAMVGTASEQDVIKRQLTDAMGRPSRLRVVNGDSQ
jgi:hypothetical protein